MYYAVNTNCLPKVSYMNRVKISDKTVEFERISSECILVFVDSGSLNLQLHTASAGSCTIAAESGFFLKPDISYSATLEKGCEYCCIHFTDIPITEFDCSNKLEIEAIIQQNRNLFYSCDPFLKDLYNRAKFILCQDFHMSKATYLKVTNLLTEAVQASNMHLEQYKILCSCRLLEILSAISTDISETVIPTHKNMTAQKAQEILDFIHHEYANHLTSESISEQFGMNFDYLNRIFKANTGITIFDYLCSIRLNHAKDMLMAGNKKLFEIAVQTGFRDEYYFSRVFHKKTGMTPRQFAKR